MLRRQASKLKIAVWHNLPSGGGKRALYNHVRGLVGRGHQLACWTLDTADRTFLPLSEFAPERIIATEYKGRSSKWITDRLSPDYNRAVRRLQAFDDACRRCALEIEAGDYDVLFANSSLDFGVPYILRHMRMKKVLYLQEPCRSMYEARSVLPWVSNTPDNLEQAGLFNPRRIRTDYPRLQALRLQSRQEWLNIRTCDLVLVNSYFSRESISRIYEINARVCYLGVDTNLFRNLNLARERFIVGLGSFDAIKGIDVAVKAMSLLPEPRPPLVWISNSGSEDYRAAITALARSLGVELHIRMNLADAEIVNILNRAALLLYTSRLEPFGFAPLEANACGLPVVGVAEGGIRETIEDGVNGFLVDPEVEPIACAVNKLWENTALARQMGEQASAHVQEKWNLEDSIDRLEGFLLQAVSTTTELT